MSFIGNLGRGPSTFSVDGDPQIKDIGSLTRTPKSEPSQERIAAELESIFQNVERHLQEQGVSF